VAPNHNLASVRRSVTFRYGQMWSASLAQCKPPAARVHVAAIGRAAHGLSKALRNSGALPAGGRTRVTLDHF
jgi:hypothetical protein